MLIALSIAAVIAGLLFYPLAIQRASTAKKEKQQLAAEQPAPLPATPSEQSQILQAVLSEKPFDVPDPTRASALRPVVLVSTTVVFCDSAESQGSDCEPLSVGDFDEIHRYVDIPRKLLQELVISNKSRSTLVFPARPDVLVRDREYVDGLLAKPVPNMWNDFDREFPNSMGFIEVSRAVLTPTRDSALIYVAHHCGGLCGTGTLILLHLKGGSWRISSETGLWIS